MYRILSLDGGGSWALIQARALIDLFGTHTRGHAVLKHFDFVAANSGGSIVLGGLVCDMTLGEIRELFESETARRSIFVPTSFLSRIPFVGPKYKTAAKHKGLRAQLNKADRQMDEFKEAFAQLPHMLIVGFDYDKERAVFFRTNRNSAASGFPRHKSDVTLVDAIHASSTAPIRYFDGPANVDGRRYWDGAMGGYNNPTLAAVVEAVANGKPRSDIKVLSLGTGTAWLPDRGTTAHGEMLKLPRPKSTKLKDALKASTVIVGDPPDAATFVAHVLIGGPLPADADQVVEDGPIVRMNPVLQPVLKNNRWELPEGIDADTFRALSALELDAIKDTEIQLVNTLCSAWFEGAIVNQGVRRGADGRVEIGHALYSLAKRAVTAWLHESPDQCPHCRVVTNLVTNS